MMIEGGWSYSSTQADFVKYFDRLKEIGMSFDEIKMKLPQLEKYYQEMVLDYRVFELSLFDFFKQWKINR